MALTDAQKKQQERHAEYWRKREADNLIQNLKSEKNYEKELERIYKDMLDGCQNEINAFYTRYANKEGITIAEAKKRVRTIDMDAYERKAKRYVKAANADMKVFGRDYKNSPGAAYYFSDKANEEMRLYNLTMKVNRLEMLKANIGLELIKGHAELETFMEDILQGRTEDELKRQAGILGKTIRNNAQTAHAIVRASFHNAKFSDRVWAYHSQMKADLSKLLEQGLIAGKNPRVLAKDLQKYFIGEPKLKNGRKGAVHAAERLMRTELARVQTEAQRQSMIRNGFTQYTFVTNTGCCPICAAISDKHFMVKDMLPGKNAPPMHPYCRCSIAAYDESEDYKEWLDFLSKGGTTEEYNKLKAQGLPTKIRKTKKKAEKELPKAQKDGKITLSADDFSETFKSKKELSNTKKFVDYVNKLKGADKNVLKLYKSFGKIEQYDKHGVNFTISHGKNHAINYSYNPITGKYSGVKLVIPKLKGENLAGQIGTMLHEKMHLIDMLLKKDPWKAGKNFAAANTKFVEAFKATDGNIGSDVMRLFTDFEKEFKATKDRQRKLYFEKHEEIVAKYFPDGRTGRCTDFYNYDKEFKKLSKEMEELNDYEFRNVMGGHVNALQDIYDALSGGRYRDAGVVIYGHGTNYFRSEENQIAEVVANYAQLSVARPDLVEMLRKDKPELVGALDELIEDMGKAVDNFE